MKMLVIYAHPNPASFCAALLRTGLELLTAAGVETRVHDLYQLKFEPVLSGSDFEALAQGEVAADIAGLQADITWADHLLMIHPTWWMGMPAIMKGYLDRVLSYGFAFVSDATGTRGLLSGRKAILVQTTGGTEEFFAESGLSAAIHDTVDKGVLGFCGIELIAHHYCYAVPSVPAAERAAMLAAFRNLLVESLGLETAS